MVGFEPLAAGWLCAYETTDLLQQSQRRYFEAQNFELCVAK